MTLLEIQQIYWWAMWLGVVYQTVQNARRGRKLQAARREVERQLDGLQRVSEVMEKTRQAIAEWHLAIGRMFEQCAAKYPDEPLMRELHEEWQRHVLNGGRH